MYASTQLCIANVAVFPWSLYNHQLFGSKTQSHAETCKRKLLAPRSCRFLKQISWPPPAQSHNPCRTEEPHACCAAHLASPGCETLKQGFRTNSIASHSTESNLRQTLGATPSIDAFFFPAA